MILDNVNHKQKKKERKKRKSSFKFKSRCTIYFHFTRVLYGESSESGDAWDKARVNTNRWGWGTLKFERRHFEMSHLL